MKKLILKFVMLTVTTAGLLSISSCEKEKSFDYLTMRYKVSNGDEFNVSEDGMSEGHVPIQLYHGPYVNNSTGEHTKYFWDLVPHHNDVFHIAFEGKTVDQMHFEGDNVYMFFNVYEDAMFDYISGSGVVDLSHSDEDYIEGTFSGTFVRKYPFVNGEPPHVPQAEDTIHVYDGYFKVSIYSTYQRTN